MSSDRPTGGPSSAADESFVDPGFVSLVRLRGAPLIDALEERAPGSRERADATGSYAFAAAAGIGLPRTQAELCRETARLHDVGKLYVPRVVLDRGAKEASGEDRELLDSHHETGSQLARGAGVPETVCDWLLHVRERFDGRGPEGLEAASIPVASRVSRAAHACHTTLTELADAAETGAIAAAIARLRKQAGHELDPEAVEALAELLLPG